MMRQRTRLMPRMAAVGLAVAVVPGGLGSLVGLSPQPASPARSRPAPARAAALRTGEGFMVFFFPVYGGPTTVWLSAVAVRVAR